MSLVLQCVLICSAIALAAAAATYIRLVAKIREVESHSNVVVQNAIGQIEKLGKELLALRERLDDCERRCVPVTDYFVAPPSVHLNRRGQVAQLHRRGESARNISSALGISQGEVKLLMKVHNLNRSEADGDRENPSLKWSRIFDKASGVNEGTT